MTPLESAIATIETQPPSRDGGLTEAKCRALMRGYDARWSGERYVVDTIETFVGSDLWNPETSRKSRSFRLAAKLDLTGWKDGRRIIMDHKTTSDDIEDPDSPYWKQLRVEAQASHYAYMEWLNGRRVDDIIWDVIKKPTIAPKTLAKADVTKVMLERQYCGFSVSDGDYESVCRNGRETPGLYELRLAHDCITERPSRYFQRRTVPRLDAEILEWAGDLWGHSQDILYYRQFDRWAKNEEACMNYGRPCRYLGVCVGEDSIDSDRWRLKPWMHKELPAEGGDGRNVLTNSRLKVLKECRRKHLYDFEVGVERVNEEKAESLYFGDMMHLAIAAWFEAQRENNGSIQNDANATA